MASTVTFMNTATPSSFAIKSSRREKHDVQTNLQYWNHPNSQVVTFDVANPEAQEAMKARLSELEIMQPVVVHDIRGEESEYTLDRNGFQYVQHHVEKVKDWSDEDHVKEVLLPSTEELIKRVTGATKVITFQHRIRCFAEDSAQLRDNRAPAFAVHSDFTTEGSIKNLKDYVKDEAERKRLLEGRILILNVWRPLRTIRKDPLGVLDWTSVDPEVDIIRNRLEFPQGWHELAKAVYSPSHRWYHLAGQSPDEPLIFKQYDNKAEGGMNLLHSAFVDPQYIDSDARQSIEIKMFAFIEK